MGCRPALGPPAGLGREEPRLARLGILILAIWAFFVPNTMHSPLLMLIRIDPMKVDVSYSKHPRVRDEGTGIDRLCSRARSQ